MPAVRPAEKQWVTRMATAASKNTGPAEPVRDVHETACCVVGGGPGGVMLVDNTLWSRRVFDPGVDDADTVALRRFNGTVAADDRVRVVMLPLGDGVTLIQRKPEVSAGV